MATISDINAEARALCDADTTTYTAADLLRRINHAYEQVVAWIIGADGRWQFDDTNYSTFPIGTTTLVNSQNDYAFDSSMLEIERVQVLDQGGIWHELNPIDISEIDGAIDEFEKVDGLPMYYDKQGASLLLYPAPDNGTSVTLANGLKVWFKRTASIYTSAEVTTGTKTPGFASPFHMILAYMAAIPYCALYHKDRVQYLELEVEKMKKELLKFYGLREQDRRKVLCNRGVDSR